MKRTSTNAACPSTLIDLSSGTGYLGLIIAEHLYLTTHRPIRLLITDTQPCLPLIRANISRNERRIHECRIDVECLPLLWGDERDMHRVETWCDHSPMTHVQDETCPNCIVLAADLVYATEFHNELETTLRRLLSSPFTSRIERRRNTVAVCSQRQRALDVSELDAFFQRFSDAAYHVQKRSYSSDGTLDIRWISNTKIQ
jgi:hypothetical protein